MTLVPHFCPPVPEIIVGCPSPIGCPSHGWWTVGITKILYSGSLHSLRGAAVTNYYKPGGFSWSCCNKLLQTRWLKIICFHHSGSQKSEINTSAALILSGGSEKTFVPGQSATFSWLPAVPGIPWLRAASLSSLLLFSHGILPSLYVSVTKFLFSYKNANCCI